MRSVPAAPSDEEKMNIKSRLPLGILNPLRDIKRSVRLFLMRLVNSARALLGHDPGYALDIQRYGPFEVAFRRGTSDEDVVRHSFEDDIFFSNISEYSPEPDHVILDVGAHIGTFSLLAATKVPRGRVYAVEACRESYHYLRINAALNRLDNIDASHLALSDREGSIRLYYNVGNWGHTTVRRLSGRGEDVPADTLENFFADKKIDRCHFVKFNCEGAEFPILLKAPGDLLGRIERMVVLYHRDLAPKFELSDLLKHLEDSGFHMERREFTAQRGTIFALRNR